jgi:adapter protein MecA 1/2
MEDQAALFGAVKDAVRSAVEGFSRAVEASNMNVQDNFVPLNQSAQKIATDQKETPIPKRTHTVVYSFPKLDDVCGAAQYLKTGFCGDNTLYKDMTGGKYYLVLSNGGQTTEQFTKVCNVLSEYGTRKHNSYALQAYFEEHYLCVIRSNALQTLAVL